MTTYDVSISTEGKASDGVGWYYKNHGIRGKVKVKRADLLYLIEQIGLNDGHANLDFVDWFEREYLPLED